MSLNNGPKTCPLCDADFIGYGHNGQPLVVGRVCDDCNAISVIPARLTQLASRPRPPAPSPEETEGS